MTTIISDGKKLSAYIQSTLKGYKTYGARVHIAVVSALAFAAATGQNAMLNQVYEGLRSNDQTAMKLFIRRAHVINGMVLGGADFLKATPDGLEAEVIVGFASVGAVVELSKGQFSVVRGHNTPEAAGLAKLLHERLINPDGEIDRQVLDRNNFAEVKTLGDTQVLEQLIKLATSIESDSDTKRVAVTKPIRDFLLSLKDKAETMLGQTTLSQG